MQPTNILAQHMHMMFGFLDSDGFSRTLAVGKMGRPSSPMAGEDECVRTEILITRVSAHHEEAKHGSVNLFKLWYFCYYGGQYAQSFSPLIFLQCMNFAPYEIGILLFLRRLCIVIFTAPFAQVCDKYGKHCILVVFGLVIHYTLSLLLALVRRFRVAVVMLVLRKIAVSCVDAVVNSAAMATLEETDSESEWEQEWGNGGKSKHYGKLRAWGSVGWGTSAMVCTAIVDRIFSGNTAVILYSKAGIGIVVIVVTACKIDFSLELFERHAARKAKRPRVEVNEKLKAARMILRSILQV